MQILEINRLNATLLESNVIGVGARLGPDQKGVPEDVTESLGKLYSSCTIELLNNSSNLRRPQTIHSSNVSGLDVTKNAWILVSVSM